MKTATLVWPNLDGLNKDTGDFTLGGTGCSAQLAMQVLESAARTLITERMCESQTNLRTDNEEHFHARRHTPFLLSYPDQLALFCQERATSYLEDLDSSHAFPGG